MSYCKDESIDSKYQPVNLCIKTGVTDKLGYIMDIFGYRYRISLVECSDSKEILILIFKFFFSKNLKYSMTQKQS